jgi:RNA polymerase sigma-70 factor (ECF subfamily)
VDDAQAVSLTLEGDPRGPETLLARYKMDVYNASLRLLRNSADAEDATQDVFMRAFSRLHQYRPGEPFGAWLQGITRHRCLDLIRARRPTAELAAADTAASTSPATWVGGVGDVEETALAQLDAERVRRALDQLGERERTLLVLRYWEDQSVEAVARAVGIAEGAARVALLRARRALAAQLGAWEVENAL